MIASIYASQTLSCELNNEITVESTSLGEYESLGLADGVSCLANLSAILYPLTKQYGTAK
jgi:hypothetical protein